jgi:hypothetical protein
MGVGGGALLDDRSRLLPADLDGTARILPLPETAHRPRIGAIQGPAGSAAERRHEKRPAWLIRAATARHNPDRAICCTQKTVSKSFTSAVGFNTIILLSNNKYLWHDVCLTNA